MYMHMIHVREKNYPENRKKVYFINCKYHQQNPTILHGGLTLNISKLIQNTKVWKYITSHNVNIWMFLRELPHINPYLQCKFCYSCWSMRFEELRLSHQIKTSKQIAQFLWFIL